MNIEIKDVIDWCVPIFTALLGFGVATLRDKKHFKQQTEQRDKEYKRKIKRRDEEYERDIKRREQEKDQEQKKQLLQKDKEFLSFCRGIFYRRAFWGYYVAYTSQAEFQTEIEHIILAIRSGCLRTQSGEKASQLNRGVESISNEAWKQTLRDVDHRLENILTLLRDGRDERMESVTFSADQFRQYWSVPGALVIYLIDNSNSLSNYLREQFSQKTLELLSEYDEKFNRQSPQGLANLPKELRETLADDLNVILRGDTNLCDLANIGTEKLSDFTKMQIKQPVTGDALARLNRYILEDVYDYKIPRTMEAGINRERDEIIEMMNSIWKKSEVDEFGLKIPTTTDWNYNDLQEDD
jgi:hypothetical protein